LAVATGEGLLRLTVPGHARIERATAFDLEVGGAELNFLIALGQLGCRSRFVTRLPSNPLGQRVAAHARSFGVELEVEWDPHGRVGLYFVELGASPRPAEVFYDRVGSSASRLEPGSFDWSRILDGAQLFHSTGITCALGQGAEKTVLEALGVARASGVTTSFDVNYRSRLWSEEAAAASLNRVLPSVDVLFASPRDLQMLATDSGSSTELAKKVRSTFGVEVIVMREQENLTTSTVAARVTAADRDGTCSHTESAEVLDPFGAGDVAAAAFLASWLRDRKLEEAVRLAARACAYMYTVPGDAWVSRDADLTTDPFERRVRR
jgi:2-dehydro-3-deoxygluconokinase